MNPHNLFIGIMLVSLGLTTAALFTSGKIDALLDLAKTLGITLTAVGIVLVVTRRYWQNARRLM